MIATLHTHQAPIRIASKPGDVKHIGHSLKDVDATKAWQWAEV